MPDLDATTIMQLVGGAIASLALYGAKGDEFRALLSKFLPKATQQKQAIANQDAAWRMLVDDSRARGDREGVKLQDQWMQLRNEHGLTDGEK